MSSPWIPNYVPLTPQQRSINALVAQLEGARAEVEQLKRSLQEEQAQSAMWRTSAEEPLAAIARAMEDDRRQIKGLKDMLRQEREKVEDLVEQKEIVVGEKERLDKYSQELRTYSRALLKALGKAEEENRQA